jgi:hypothetical protein
MMSNTSHTTALRENRASWPALASYAVGIGTAVWGLASYVHLVPPCPGVAPTALMMGSPFVWAIGAFLDHQTTERRQTQAALGMYYEKRAARPAVVAPVLPAPTTFAMLAAPVSVAPTVPVAVQPHAVVQPSAAAPSLAAVEAAPIVFTFESLRGLPTLLQQRVLSHLGSVPALEAHDPSRANRGPDAYRVRIDGPRYDIRLA